MLCLNERLPRYALHISQLDPSSKAALGSTKAPTRCTPSESKSTPVCTCRAPPPDRHIPIPLSIVARCCASAGTDCCVLRATC